MTFEQLIIFVAVAEREHLTQAAEAVHLTPSAVSSAIKNLEGFYGVELFHRVGRRIELTATGRTFLIEAKSILARVRAAELLLSELGGLQRGNLGVGASQTIASYWLPPVLMAFRRDYPGIRIDLTIGNTRTVAEAVLEGQADVGLVEGEVEAPALSSFVIAQDALVVVVGAHHPWAKISSLSIDELVRGSQWIMREEGSGTRSEFENALKRLGGAPRELDVAFALPSNEAVLSAVRAGTCAAAISHAAAGIYLQEGILAQVPFTLPKREFRLLRHKERHATKASAALEKACCDWQKIAASRDR
jgi:DNA-binding transcriptional LysR family regulator